jgi:diguanylate cyclase (GGDEF)-like protein
MISFLISIQAAGFINTIYWSVPAYIIPMHQQSFVDLFPAVEKEIVLDLIGKCLSKDAVVSCDNPLRMSNDSDRLVISMLKDEDQICVFGQSEELSSGAVPRIEFENIIHRFMKTLKFSLKRNDSGYDASDRFQFDKIQNLNSELVNTRRMLEKTNAQLQIVNRDLNNRLVKDALTGLVSRYQYRSEIEFMIAGNPGTMGVFTFMDIDDFKAVNDGNGHATGDSYLVGFSDRLKSLPVDKTVKMRISGDEFGLFTYGLRDAGTSAIQSIWDQIEEHVLRQPIDVGGKCLPVSVSAGMAIYGVDTMEIYELIEFADYAMYCAKRDGKRGYRIFSRADYEMEKKPAGEG